MTAIKSNPAIQEDYIIPYPKSGIIIEARKGSKAKGVSVAIGEGVISNDKQIVLGRYNIPNTTDILQIGGGSNSNIWQKKIQKKIQLKGYLSQEKHTR